MTGQKGLPFLRDRLNGGGLDGLTSSSAVNQHAAGRAAGVGQARRVARVDGDVASRRAYRRLVLLQKNARRRRDAVGRVGRREAVDGQRRRAAGHQGQLGRERVLMKAAFRRMRNTRNPAIIVEA